MDRMHALGPSFVDVTWGAGGRSSQLTCEMVNVAQSVYGLETCMHLTCTDMETSKVDEALKEAYKAGCTNILALRGDPPREKEKWVAVDGGFRYAKDLVRYIRDAYGDHFDIGVAGYPEGCEDHDDAELLMDHLGEKIDAGATFIVTQMFYDVENFLSLGAKVPCSWYHGTHRARHHAHSDPCRLPATGQLESMSHPSRLDGSLGSRQERRRRRSRSRQGPRG